MISLFFQVSKVARRRLIDKNDVDAFHLAVSLAEHERVISNMQVTMKKMERIIEIQAGQIERLEDTAADYIVFRDRLASLFGRGE